MRGVRQLRGFAPLADGTRAVAAASPSSGFVGSTCCILPRPELQIEVERPGQPSYWLDLGVQDLRYAAEYDGEEWHLRTPEQSARDARRRTWMREERGWIIDVVTKANLFGTTATSRASCSTVSAMLVADCDPGQMNRPVVRSMNSVSRSCSPFS